MDILDGRRFSIALTPYAAALHEIFDKQLGRALNLVLGSEEAHLFDPSYSGNTVGAYAGRIRDCVLVIDGVSYQLDANDGVNSIHGGFHSLRRLWTLKEKRSNALLYETRLSHLEDGLPGNRLFTSRYILRDDGLELLLCAQSDRPTYFNLTNHTYFCLGSSGCELDDLLQIEADEVVVNDEAHLPLEIISVKDTPFDFRSARKIGEGITGCKELAFSKGLNNAFLLKGPITLSSADASLRIESDAPSAVIYSGGYLEKPSSAIAIEPEGSVLFSCAVTGTLKYCRQIKYRFL